MQKNRNLTLHLYRSLLRHSKKLDSQSQLKLLIPHPLSKTTNLFRFLDDTFRFNSLYFDDDLYYSTFPLVKHVRMAFRYTQQLYLQSSSSSSSSSLSSSLSSSSSSSSSPSSSFLQTNEHIQLAFEALKQLNHCLNIAKYIQLDTNEWYVSPTSASASISAQSLSHLLSLNQTDLYNLKTNDFNDIKGDRINPEHIQDVDERIQHYKKCIAENPTAEAHTNLGWTCYLKGKYTEYFRLKNKYTRRKSTNVMTSLKSQSQIIQTNFHEPSETTKIITNDKNNEISNDDKSNMLHELSNILPKEENVQSLQDGINLCKKHCRIAIDLDNKFADAYNNLGLMLMMEMQKGSNKGCEDEIEVLFQKAKQYQLQNQRNATRSPAFRNHAKYLKNYKQDFKESLKNYIWAVYFDREDSESRDMIDRLLPEVASAANL